MDNGIRSIETRQDGNGAYESVRVVFGPHYFVEIHRIDDGATFVLGATHHGFKADASALDGELKRIIYEVREAHPQNEID